MIFVVSPLTVLHQVLLLDTYHQPSVTTVYDHMLADGHIIDNVALVENAWLILSASTAISIPLVLTAVTEPMRRSVTLS